MKDIRTLIFLILFWLIFIVQTLASDESEIKPKFYDSNPSDGRMDPGSSINPWVVKDKQGRETYEIKPKYYDSNPHDGYNDPGSSVNPYEIKPIK